MTIQEFNTLSNKEKEIYLNEQEFIDDEFAEDAEYEDTLREIYDDWIADMYISEMKNY